MLEIYIKPSPQPLRGLEETETLAYRVRTRSTWSYCPRSVAPGRTGPLLPLPNPGEILHWAQKKQRSKLDPGRGGGESREHRQPLHLALPGLVEESPRQSLHCEGSGLLAKVSSSVTAVAWPDSQRVPSHTGQSTKFPQGPISEGEGLPKSHQDANPILRSGVTQLVSEVQEGQGPGLRRCGWESPHPSCSRSSISSSHTSLGKQQMEKAGEPPISQEGHGVLPSSHAA